MKNENKRMKIMKTRMKKIKNRKNKDKFVFFRQYYIFILKFIKTKSIMLYI